MIVLMPIVQLALAQPEEQTEWVRLEDAHLMFQVPIEWTKYEIEKYDIIQVLSPDQTTGLVFVSMEDNKAKLILDELEQTVMATIEDINFKGEPKMKYTNGLPTVVSKGTAVSNDGSLVRLRMWLVINDNKSLLTFGISNIKENKRYERDIELITSSIQTFDSESSS